MNGYKSLITDANIQYLEASLSCSKAEMPDKCTTRWYPWGIQRLVSTYSRKGEGGYSPDQLKLKVPRSAQIFISGGGGGAHSGIFEHKIRLGTFWKPLHHR